MSQQQNKKSSKSTTTTQEDTEIEPLPTESVADSELADAVDSLLDEIDEVLEENAEEFVRQYIQKGGQ